MPPELQLKERRTVPSQLSQLPNTIGNPLSQDGPWDRRDDAEHWEASYDGGFHQKGFPARELDVTSAPRE